jgi:hypothetical protein
MVAVWQVCCECEAVIHFGDVARAEWCEPDKVVWQCGSCVYDYEVLNDLEW